MIIDTDGSVCDLMKNLRIILGISLSLAARKNQFSSEVDLQCSNNNQDYRKLD